MNKRIIKNLHREHDSIALNFVVHKFTIAMCNANGAQKQANGQMNLTTTTETVEHFSNEREISIKQHNRRQTNDQTDVERKEKKQKFPSWSMSFDLADKIYLTFFVSIDSVFFFLVFFISFGGHWQRCDWAKSWRTSSRRSEWDERRQENTTQKKNSGMKTTTIEICGKIRLKMNSLLVSINWSMRNQQQTIYLWAVFRWP